MADFKKARAIWSFQLKKKKRERESGEEGERNFKEKKWS